MKSSIDNASARHDTGGLSSVSGRGDDKNNLRRGADIAVPPVTKT
jgi:hypothetical protein